LISFQVQVPAGASSIQSRYCARAIGIDEGYPTTTWQALYILAPARQWQSFGRLEVSVQLPENWEHGSTPQLERDGDELRGSFDGLPGDALIVSTRAPVGPSFNMKVKLYVFFYIAMLIAACASCWICSYWIGRWFGLRPSLTGRWSDELRLMFVVLSGGLSGAAAFGAALWALLSVSALPGSQESPYYHEQFTLPFLGSLLITIAVTVFGPMVSSLAVERGSKRSLNRVTGN
jgi:hypothetical protein